MILTDAIGNDNYSPIFDDSNTVDIVGALDSSKIENLVTSIISSYDLPKDVTASIILDSLYKDTQTTRDEINSLVPLYNEKLKSAGGSSSEITSITEEFVSDVISIISASLSKATSNFDYEIIKTPETDTSTQITSTPNPNTPTKEYKEGLEKTDKSWQDTSEHIVQSWGSEKDDQDWKSTGFGSVKDTLEGMGSQFKENYSGDSILSELSKPVEELTVGLVTDLLEEPVKAIASSDTYGLVSNFFGTISGMASEVVEEVVDSFKGIYSQAINASVETVDEIVNDYKNYAVDEATGLVESAATWVNEQKDKYYEKLNDFKDWATAPLKLKNVMQLDNFKKYKNLIRAEDNIQKIRIRRKSATSDEQDYASPLVSNLTQTAKNWVAVKRSDFKVNSGDFYMTNDAYWDVKIFPHKYDGYGPPSINEIFGCESSNRLPMLSYTLDAGGLSNSSFEIYPGVQFSIPLTYSRASMFSCTLVNLVDTKNSKSCFDRFRDDYVSYVLGSGIENSLDSLPACLDYHYCAYEITVVKYSQQWNKLRSWQFLGIPQITIYEQGQSSSSQEIQTLNFSIIGGNDSGSVKNKKVNPTNRENLEPEEGWSPGANRGYYEE